MMTKQKVFLYISGRIFMSLQSCSIRFKSGLWLGHSTTFRDLSRSRSCVVLAVGLGVLSYWKGNLSAQDLRLGRSFTFQQGNDPKRTAKTTQERLRDKSLNVLEWPSQNPIKHLWRDLKIAVQWSSVSNLTKFERICREECEELPKYRYAKLVASYPRSLKAVIAAKCASTKYWVKGLNNYVNIC